MKFPLARLAARPLWEWLVHCAFLAAVTLLLMGVVANALLWQLGLPYVFWHESAGRRVFAGIGVGMFTVNVAVVGFLLASRRPWISELRAFWPQWDAGDYVVGLLARYLLLTSAVLVAAVWLFTLRAPYYLGWAGRALFALSVTFGAVAAAFCLWQTRRLAESHARRRTWLGRVLVTLDRSPGARSYLPVTQVHRAAAVFFLGQLVFFVACGVLSATRVGQWMSAGLALAVFLTVVVSAYGAVRWWAEDEKLVVFAGLLVLWVALAAAGPYRHTLYDLRAEYRHPVPITVRPPLNAALLGTDATMAAWGKRCAKEPLVVVAVDGGGIRAATWIVSMLATLEKDLPQFAYHVRVITGASGGMVGAAYWVSTLQPPAGPAAHAAKGRPLDANAMIDAVSKDSLEATTRRLVFRDISPLVWQAYADRGYAMEHQWEANTGAMDETLADLAPGEAGGWRPSLVFSPMIVEDGRRLLVSNLDLGNLVATRMPGTAAGAAPASLSALELAKMVPAARSLRVSTVARMSASFPYVSPAAEVPTRPLRRVVDAGYYDEHGVALAAAWMLANDAAIAAYTSKVVLIQIPDQSTAPSRLPDPCARSWWSRGLSDLLSPPEGVLAGWSGAMGFRNDEVVQAAGRILGARGVDFRSFVFEPYDQVPPPDPLYSDSPGWDACAREYCARAAELRPVVLSWHMISGHREFLRGASPHTQANCAARRALLQWWTGSAAAPELPGCRTPAPTPAPLCSASTLSVQ